MYYRGGYVDGGDSREMGLKRQRIMDQSSSYYSIPLGSSYMYNPAPPPPALEYPYIGQPPPPLPIVRLRGLPFGCTEGEIADFMHGLDVVDVLLVHKGKRFTGEAYCVLGYPLQVDFALSRNKKNIGRRYVEVFRSSKQEYYRAIANEVSDASSESIPRARSADDLAEHTGVLRMRGMPFSACKEDIIDFFKKFSLLENSIVILANSEGRPTGEAFVEFASADDSRAAMAKDRMTIGSRYIELFPSSHEELEETLARSRILQKTSEGEDLTEMTAVLRMRGLPYSAEKDDIIDFFKDFVLSEDSVHITHNLEGRPTGEAFVEFANPEDAKAALAKDRMMLGSRYIELFQSSREELSESLLRGR